MNEGETMDPNEALAKLRELMQEWRRADDGGDAGTLCDEIAEQFEALDEWLTIGGIPPAGWIVNDDDDAERIVISFRTDNAAFEVDGIEEVDRILRDLPVRLIVGESGGIRDINGSTIGAWRWR